MSLSRFYIPHEAWNPESLVIAGDEAHHCREVMRLGEGEKLVVFNGQGVEAMARIRSSSKHEVALDTLGVTKSERLPVQLTLAQAVIKGKAMERVLRRLVP